MLLETCLGQEQEAGARGSTGRLGLGPVGGFLQ